MELETALAAAICATAQKRHAEAGDQLRHALELAQTCALL
jgi:hypothetical protein